MTTQVTGGIRVRMINEAIWQMVRSSLAAQGWFDEAREHAPLNLVAGPVERDDQIPVNTLSISPEDTDEFETGLGEISVEERVTYYIDFYAESNAVALELIHDVRDILAGRMPQIGRTAPRVEVFDYREDPPISIGWVDFEDIMVDRSRTFPKPWLKHWFMVRFDVLDTYGGGEDGQ